MDLIACMPVPDDLPYVPDLVILRGADGVLHMRDREGMEPLSGTVATGKVMELSPGPWEDGMWVSVERDGTTRQFYLSDEKRWREARAKSLVDEAAVVVGDPVLKLELLSAAGAMGEVNVPRLITALEKNRVSAAESLMDIYLRMEETREKA